MLSEERQPLSGKEGKARINMLLTMTGLYSELECVIRLAGSECESYVEPITTPPPTRCTTTGTRSFDAILARRVIRRCRESSLMWAVVSKKGGTAA